MIKLPKWMPFVVIIVAGSLTLIITDGIDSISQYVKASNNLLMLNNKVDSISLENENARNKLISSNKLNTVDSVNDFFAKNTKATVVGVSAFTIVNGELELVANLDRITNVSSLQNIDALGITFRWAGDFDSLFECLLSNNITFMEMKVNTIKNEVYISVPT